MVFDFQESDGGGVTTAPPPPKFPAATEGVGRDMEGLNLPEKLNQLC